MAVALLKFTQGANVGDNGEALLGDLANPFLIANSDNAGIGSWEVQVLEVPYGSAVTKGVLAQANGSTPAGSVTPDVAGGCWRIQLRVWPQANRQGAPDTDIRCFGVLGDNGLISPPPQLWPLPLPHPSSGRPGAKPNEANFAGQDGGWAGQGNDGLLRHALRLIGQGSLFTDRPEIFGGGADLDLIASSGTTTLTGPTYYRTVELTGSAKIETAGYPLHIQNWVRPLAGQIIRTPNVGGNGTIDSSAGNTGGAALPDTAYMGGSSAGGQGGDPSTGAGQAGSAGAALSGAGGGAGGAGGAGGTGAAAAGAAGAAGALTTLADRALTLLQRLWYYTSSGTHTRISGGAGGGGGGGGSGNSAGGGGGTGAGGGSGGGAMDLRVGKITTDVTTPAGCVVAKGGNGGNGSQYGTGGAGNKGGGAGGGGGGGGYIYAVIGEVDGPSVAGFFDASGGNGGTGGIGLGTGTAGASGVGGVGGHVDLIRLDLNTCTRTSGSAAVGATGGVCVTALT